ncbi:collagen-binding domain-containing protein [Agromyces sp. MMS24-JH15]|uniref:collagen-binding domain-containing protein n=1 Tax=Agromyces sp. MMS24-JH15 TaxID=3243765 RepID=UPI003748CDFB
MFAALGAVLLAIGLAATGSTATGGTASAAPAVRGAVDLLANGRAAVNPLSPTGGYTVYARTDAELANHEFEGSIAVGGELRITQAASYQFAHVIAGSGAYVLPIVDGDPTRVLIGSYGPDPATNPGRAEISSLGATQPSQYGDLKIVDRAAPFVSFTRGSWLRYALTSGSDSPPLIDAENQVYPDDSTPPTTADGDGSIFTVETAPDTAAVVRAYVEASADASEDEIDQCFGEITDPGSGVGYPVTILEDAGDRIVLGTLVPDRPNVLEYAAIEGATLLQFSDGSPGPRNPLVIHVAPGTTSVLPPAIDPQGTYSPFVVWDLSEVTGPVDISTGGRGDGSIYAPHADLTVSAQPWDGQIIANSIVLEGGEMHTFLFAGSLPCDTPVDAGTFSVAKALAGVDPGDLAPGTVFRVGYIALEPDGTLTRDVLLVSPDGTPASPATTFPFGTRVVVFEIPPDDDVLPPDLAWTDVTWSDDTTFVIDASNPSVSLTVTDTAGLVTAGFSVSKSLTGSGATVVPSDAEFTLEYQVDGGAPIQLAVSPESPAVVGGLEPGDVITLGEISFPDVDGVIWGTPTWSIDGQPVAPDAGGDIEFTLVGGETIAVELTNTADGVGSFAIGKAVVGNGMDDVPDGTTFPVVYSVDGGPETTLQLPPGEVLTIDGLPAGAVVTIREGPLPDVPGIEWGTPAWTIDGEPQVPDPDGSVTFVVQPGTTVGLSLTNTANGFGWATLLKTVSGSASGVVPGTAFTVEYRISNGPVGSFQVSPGVPVTSPALPTGMTAWLRETPPAVTGVAWGEPTWTIDGVRAEPDADGWVSFQPATGTAVEFVLANTGSAVLPASGVDAGGVIRWATALGSAGLAVVVLGAIRRRRARSKP